MPIMASGWHSRSKGPSFAFFGPVRFFKPEGEPEIPDENQTANLPEPLPKGAG